MTDKEILEKAIKKAMSRGMTFDVKYQVLNLINPAFLDSQIHIEIEVDKGLFYRLNPEKIIFNHDFAKAFWGEMEFGSDNECPNCRGEGRWREYYDSVDERCDKCEGLGRIYHYKNKGWQYHLQQMVLEENPIKYLEKFL